MFLSKKHKVDAKKKKVKQKFNKKFSINNGLRHSFLSQEFQSTIEEVKKMEETMKQMGSSIGHQQSKIIYIYYILTNYRLLVFIELVGIVESILATHLSTIAYYAIRIAFFTDN